MMKFIAFFAKAIAYGVSHLPYPLQVAIGQFLGFLWLKVFRIRRDVVMSNLNLAFPSWSDDQKMKVAEASCFNLGMTLVEFCRIPFVTKDKNKKENV